MLTNLLGLNPKGSYQKVSKNKKTTSVLCSPTPYSERVKLGSFMSQWCNVGKEMYKMA